MLHLLLSGSIFQPPQQLMVPMPPWLHRGHILHSPTHQYLFRPQPTDE
ncbi:hypothetical protein EC960109_5980, partial [Escherichia coli 96.0109]